MARRLRFVAAAIARHVAGIRHCLSRMCAGRPRRCRGTAPGRRRRVARVRPRCTRQSVVAARADHDAKMLARLVPAWTYHTGETRARIRRPATQRSLEVTPLVVDGADVHQHAARARHGAGSGDRARAVEVRPEGRSPRRVRRLHEPRRLVLDGQPPNGTAATRPCAHRVFVATIDGAPHRARRASGHAVRRLRRGGHRQPAPMLRNQPSETAEYEVTSPPAIINDIGRHRIGRRRQRPHRCRERRGARVRRAHRRAALDVGSDSAGLRPMPAWHTWVGPTRAPDRRGERVERDRRRPGARSGLRPDRQRQPRLLRRRAARRQSLCKLHRRACAHRRGGRLALPGRAPRSLGLRRRVAAGARDADARTAERFRSCCRRRRPDSCSCCIATRACRCFRSRSGRCRPATSRRTTRAPTQPFNTVLPPLSPQRLTPDDALGAHDADRAACRAHIAACATKASFTPPSERGTLVYPSTSAARTGAA